MPATAKVKSSKTSRDLNGYLEHEDEPKMRLGGLYAAVCGICFANQSSILKRNLPQAGV